MTGAGLIGSLAVLGILIVWLAWGALCGWAAKQKGQSVAVLTIAGLPLAVIDLEQPSIEESVRKRLGLRPADRGGESAILVTCPLVAGPERCTASLNGLSALAANRLICPKA